VDGRLRRWYVYAPPDNQPDERLPLVLALHGYTDLGATFAERSEWYNVAQSRRFLVLFPCAYPYARPRQGGRCCPLPAWDIPFFPRDDGVDDIAFLRHVLCRTEAVYPVDRTRLYATGHSNGSRLTQRLMREWPIFAAYGPVGATETDQTGLPYALPPSAFPRPVWLMMSEHDVGDAARMDADSETYKTMRQLCEANAVPFDGAYVTTNGSWTHWVMRTEAGVPLVRFTQALGLPHAYVPSIAWMLWDEFFVDYVKKEDGSVWYMGHKVPNGSNPAIFLP
jgi:polyhydroxybutyrate depolymerase